MPRVLRIINRLNLGGPTFNAALLSKYMAPDYETILVAGMKEESEASSEFIVRQLGLDPIYIGDMFRSIHPLKDWRAYQQLKTLIRRFKPDIVHTHAAKSGTLGRLAAHACGVPVIVHTFHGHVFHSYFNPIKTRVFLEIERYLAKISHKIIAISPKQKEELSETYKVCHPNKIQTVPLGFDLSRFQKNQINKRIDFRQKHQIADDEIAIALVGRVVPIKNHALFLQALKNVLTRTQQKVRAFIVGDGEERAALEQLATQLNIDYSTPEQTRSKATLTFTSWIKQVDEVYAGIDIVALSSLNEGTPVSLIEAQAANKPIVTTNVGGVSDVTLPNTTALLSASKSVADFANNMLQLVESADLRTRMGQKGSDFVQQKYGYQRLVGDMSALYEQLLWQASPIYRPISVPTPPINLEVAPLPSW